MRIKGWLAAFLCGIILCLSGGLPVQAAGPGISSLSAVVYEPQSGTVLYEKYGDTARPMASTTKLMTALLAAECLQPDATVSVPAAALPVEGSQVGLMAEDRVTVRDLLAGLLLASGNDTANALALLMEDSLPAFAQRMNARAKELGMTHSLFVTPSGLDEGGHSASARDMALLGAAVLKQPLLAQLCASKTAAVTIGGRRMTLKNHNKLLSLYDGCIGMKTGFTKKSGRCLVSAAQRDGVTLVIATLNGGDYWNDHIALYNYAFSLVRRETASPPDLPPLSVAGGTAEWVALVADTVPDFVLLQGEMLTCRVTLPRFAWAPLEAGQVVGQMIYTAGDRLLAQVPVRAAAGVGERPLPSATVLWGRRLLQLLDVLIR